MPIFFHLESHLWIALLLFLNGSLFYLAIASKSKAFASLHSNIEAKVVVSFLLAIALNGGLLFALDLAGLSFSLMAWLLPLALSLMLLVIARCNSVKTFRDHLNSDWSVARLLLYLVIFVILFYNGALIDQVSDAWWHMSQANQIGIESSFSLPNGHLTGEPSRFYPPLWHGNLSLINTLSGVSLPVIWNSFTAWGSVLKAMAFYLFALGFSNDKRTALVAALLFVLLPGIGDSYLRVSSWPSHIAYIALFYALWLCSELLRQEKSLRAGVKSLVIADMGSQLWQQRSLIALLAFASSILYLTHQLELLWLALALMFFQIGRVLLLIFSTEQKIYAHSDAWQLRLCTALLALIAIGFTVFKYFDDKSGSFASSIDASLAAGFGIALCLFVFWVQLCSTKMLLEHVWLYRVLASVFGLFLLLSVNFQHVYSLFVPSAALPMGNRPQDALAVVGWFGDGLRVPGWHFQLRAGLLYSGLLALPVSVIFLRSAISRLALFIASLSLAAILFCISPYLFYWLSQLLSYGSTWRIATLVFHPLLWAAVVVYLFDEIRVSKLRSRPLKVEK